MQRKLHRSVIESLRSSATLPKESLSLWEPIWPMIASMAYEHILVEVQAPIATVTLNRPKVLNALSPELIEEVGTALSELDQDESVRAVVLTGGPKVFAAGADISDMADRGAVEQLRRDQTGRWAPITAFSKPLVAAVNGYALGGGCELALMCTCSSPATTRVWASRRSTSASSRAPEERSAGRARPASTPPWKPWFAARQIGR